MEKLELKHLVGYLPCNLAFYKKSLHLMYDRGGINYIADSSKRGRFISVFNKGERITTTVGTYYLNNNISYTHHDGGDKYLQYIKPILRPLSDLTKEIEVNGEKFVPIMRLRPESFSSEGSFTFDYYKQASVYILKNESTNEELHIYTDSFISVSTRKHNFNVSDYKIINKLLEWHFDIHGLIKENLAVDINTL